MVYEILAALVGFLLGFFFSNGVVYAATVIFVILFVWMGLDSRDKEIGALMNWAIMALVAIAGISMWITTISVNHWWGSIIPKGLLR